MKTSELLEKLIKMKSRRIYTYHTGIIVREKRMELKLTLEEVTRGICCISYLSKIEHGVIEAKDYILNDIVKKLNIPRELIKTEEEYRGLIKRLLYAIKERNNEEIENIYKKIFPEEKIYFAEMIRLGYNLFYENNEEALKSINKILKMKEYLDDEEMVSFIILCGMYYSSNEEYEESLRIYELLKHFSISDYRFDIMRLKGIVKDKFILGKKSSLFASIEEMNSKCLKTGDFDEIINNNLYYSLTLAANGEKEEAMKVFDVMKRNISKEKRTEWRKKLAFFFRDTNCLLTLDLSDVESLWVYDVLNDQKSVLKILGEIKRDNLQIDEKIFVELIYRKYYASNEEYISYLRTVAFDRAFDNQIHFSLLYYGRLLVYEYQRKCKYKEATIINERMSRHNSLCW